MELRAFQRRYLRAAFAPGIRTAALSISRGNGKSTLAGILAARALTPGDPLFVAGSESVLIGGSIEQCRIVFRAARRILEPTGEYRFLDSATRCAITHRASNARLRVIGSNARTTMGLALPCTHIQGWTNQLPPCSVTAWSTRTRYYRPFVGLSRKLASSGLWRRRR